MQTRSRSRRQVRRRASLCVTTALLVICAFALAYYTQSIRGIIAMLMTAAILELILVLCKSPSNMSRFGGLPWFMWIFPLAMGNVGYHFIKGSVLLRAELAMPIGVGVVSAVIIVLVRWFHFHYRDIRLIEVISQREMRRFEERTDHDA